MQQMLYSLTETILWLECVWLEAEPPTALAKRAICHAIKNAVKGLTY